MKNSLGIDLTVYSSNYKGGVTTFTEGIVMAALKQLTNWDITIYCRLNNVSDVRNKFGTHNKIIVIEPSFKSIYEKLLRIVYKFKMNFKVYVILQNVFWFKAIAKIKEENSILYIPSTYINFPSKNISSLVSLHDTQEKAFPGNFSPNQLSYRKIQALTTLRYSSIIQCSSLFVRKEILKYFNLENQDSKIIVIPEGVDILHFAFVPQNRKPMKFRIFYPSSFLKHKNHQVLIQALSLLDKNTSFEIHFTGKKNELRDEIEAKCQFFRNIKCSFLGEISSSDLLSEYSRSNLVISCSKYESSSLPILEGIAIGRPIIASDIEAHIEMAKHLPIDIFKQDDPLDLSKAIVRQIEGFKNAQVVKDFSHDAIKQFSWDNIIKEYEKYFSLLVE